MWERVGIGGRGEREIKWEKEAGKEWEIAWDDSLGRKPKEFKLLSALDMLSRHAVEVTQWPGHLITSYCSSGLTQHF